MADMITSQPLVVLTDLTGTVLHRTFREPVEGVPANIIDRAWNIYERPYAAELLQELSEHPRVSLGVFTTMTDKNAKCFLEILGWKNYFFYIYAQNEDMRWCEADHENWNAEKQRHEWKKNLFNVFDHASTELGFEVSERNCVLVDDTPRKTREYGENVIVPGRYDDAAVRGPDTHLVTLLGYLIELADNLGGDVRHYMNEHPFCDFPQRQPTRPTLAPQMGPAGTFIPRGGCLKGAAIQTLLDSNFKLFYDKVVCDGPVGLDEIHRHIRTWLEMRQVFNINEIIRKIDSPANAVRLWSSETVVQRDSRSVRPSGFSLQSRGPEKFYKFTNGEVRRDDTKAMAHVAFLVRLFNSMLVQPFRPRERRAWRGTCVPRRKIEEFFEMAVAGESQKFFRVPCFWAVSLSDHVARTFSASSSTGHGKGSKGYGGKSKGKGKGVPVSVITTGPVIFLVHLPEMLEHARLLTAADSEFPDEEEVLFPPYSLFEFRSLTKGDVWQVEVEAIADNRTGGKDLERVPCLFWS